MLRVERARRWLAVCAAALIGVAGAQALPEEYQDLASRLPPYALAQLRANAQVWAGWSAEQRSAHATQAARWHALAPAERAAQRERYAAWRALPPVERGEIQAAAARYAALPAEQQQALRARFDALDGSLRRGWLLGPTLGVDYPGLQPLLAQLPEAEHAPMLALLHELSPQQRRDLAVLAQRTPPQDRAALRRELLATKWDERQAWFWRKLGQ